MMPDGTIFGLTDNLILWLSAIYGAELERRLGGTGLRGAIYGGLIGNTISDAVAAAWDPSTRGLIVGITLGCAVVVAAAWAWYSIKDSKVLDNT